MTDTKVTGRGRHRADGTGGAMPIVEQRIVVDPALDYCPGHHAAGITEPWFCAGPGLCKEGRQAYAEAQAGDARTEVIDAITDDDLKALVEPRPARSWLVVALLVILRELDQLVTRVAYRIARFVIQHARGMAWTLVLAPAAAAVLVLGSVGVLAVLR